MGLRKSEKTILKQALAETHFSRDAGTVLNRIFAERVESGYAIHVGKVGGLSEKDRVAVGVTARKALRRRAGAGELVFDPAL